MPATIHQASLAAVAGALGSLSTVASGAVHVERPVPFDAADCPAINVLPDGLRFQVYGAGDNGGPGQLEADCGVVLRIHTVGDPHTQQADPVIAEANAALMADPSLGGLAMRLLLTDSRATADRGGAGTVGTWELTYRLLALVDEATLQPLTG